MEIRRNSGGEGERESTCSVLRIFTNFIN